MNSTKLLQALVAATVTSAWLAGCLSLDEEVPYVGDIQVAKYRNLAEGIEFEAAVIERGAIPELARGSRPLIAPREEEFRNLTLAQAVEIGLTNNAVIRQNGQFLANNATLLDNPDANPSIYDLAIQENGVLVGSRGLISALSDYDPRVTTSIRWANDENVQNNTFLGGGLPIGATLIDDTAQFRSQLEQPLTTGGTVSIFQNWDYSQNNQPNRLFTSAYTGSLGVQGRQPLWAGAGSEFSSIAGPVGNQRVGFTSLNQGVVIAQLNEKISAIDFEGHIADLVKDIGDAYWDLAYNYREYTAEVTVRDSSERLWETVKSKLKAGMKGGEAIDEAQAEDTFQEATARVENTLGNLFLAEIRLRRLLGMASDDGMVLRPIDEPAADITAPDRIDCLQTAFMNRLELKRQKTNIRSLKLQLEAATQLINPRLDLVAGYQLNGFGDKLINRSNADGQTSEGFNSAYGALLRSHQTSWQVGFELNVPLFLRNERAQARQLEFRLTKAQKTLAVQEEEIGHEISHTLQSLARWNKTGETYLKRRVASLRRVQAAQADYDAGRINVDQVLRAQQSLAQADVSYYRSLTEARKSRIELQYRMGIILPEQQIYVPTSQPTALPVNIQSAPVLPESFEDWPVLPEPAPPMDSNG